MNCYRSWNKIFCQTIFLELFLCVRSVCNGVHRLRRIKSLQSKSRRFIHPDNALHLSNVEIYCFNHNRGLKHINVRYSLKNIPIPSTKHHMKCLIDKLDNFIRRLRWKAHFFDTQSDNYYNENKNFGFKLEHYPLQHKGLNAFEADLYELARSIQFKKVHNSFFSKLSQDVKRIAICSSLFLPADKTTNLYKMGIIDSKKLLHDNVTVNCQITNASNVKQINLDVINIANNLKLDNKIEKLAKKEAFFPVKDHKPNFCNNPKCRLFNFTKFKIGIINQKLLDRINSSIRSSTGLMQWRN